MVEKDAFTVLKIIFLTFLAIDLLLGLACLGVGIWFHASADINAYLTVFVKSENDGIILACAAILLSAGLIVALLTALAGIGVFLNDARFLKLFLFLIWTIIVLGLICGFSAVGFYFDMHKYVKAGMLGQLQTQYSWESRVGKAWNRLQVKKRCCGVDGSWDYVDTDWFASQNPDPVNIQFYVPDSCCALNFNQDRELSWVDPQNIQLKDRKRCNEDAAGNKDTTANLNKQGCFSALYSRNRDNWHDMDILTILYLLMGLGLSVGFLQVFAIPLCMKYMSALKARNEAGSKNLMGRY